MPGSVHDVAIVGAGVIGLATALEFSRRFPALRLLILEKEETIAAHQSGHNSGVIHSGIYYRPGSMKAKLCVEGAAAMIAFCGEHGIAHEICGKVIVATSENELTGLHELQRRAQANGVAGVEMIGPERLQEVEPHAAGIRALWVPGTGITDYAAVTRKYAELVQAAGGIIVKGVTVVGVSHCSEEVVIETTHGDYRAGFLVNCAGLYSDRIAMLAGAEPEVRIVPFRGEYYEIARQRRGLVRALLYPVPDPDLPFLGVHFTRRVDGSVEAGPNAVLALRREGYRKTDISLEELGGTLAFGGFWRMARKWWRVGAGEYYRSFSKTAFVKALQRLVPELTADDLTPGDAGVRAQAVDGNGNLIDDFHIVRAEGAVHVLNVPSPAATASLVIGREIVKMGESCFANL